MQWTEIVHCQCSVLVVKCIHCNAMVRMQYSTMRCTAVNAAKCTQCSENLCLPECDAQLKFSAAEFIAVHCSLLQRRQCEVFSVDKCNDIQCIEMHPLHCDNRFQLNLLCMMHFRVLCKCSTVLCHWSTESSLLLPWDQWGHCLLFCCFAVFCGLLCFAVHFECILHSVGLVKQYVCDIKCCKAV